MLDKINALTITILFGSLIFLAFLLFTNPLKVNKRANRWFGFSILLWSTFWLDEMAEIVFQSGIPEPQPILMSFIQFLAPIFYYFSVWFFIRPTYRFRWSDLVYLIVPAIYLVILLLEKGQGNFTVYGKLKLVLIIGQVLFYGVFTVLKIRTYQQKIEHFTSNTSEISLKWLEYILFLILSLIILVSIYNLVFSMQHTNLFFNSFMLFIIFGVTYSALRQKEIYPVNAGQEEEIMDIETITPFNDQRRKVVSDTELVEFKTALTLLMKGKMPYKDPEINLIKLAAMLQMTPHQLSYVINTGFNENFFQFINRHRVEAARDLIANGNLNNFSLLGIAFESGFNSKTTFNNTFKKITSQTPTEYRKSCSGL